MKRLQMIMYVLLASLMLTSNQAAAKITSITPVTVVDGFVEAIDDSFKDVVPTSSFSGIIKASFISSTLMDVENFFVKFQVKVGNGWSTIASGENPFSKTFDTSTFATHDFRWVISGDYLGGTPGVSLGNKGTYSATLNVAAVPEPEEWVLLTVGLAMVGYQVRRKQQSIEGSSLSA